jgi:hypothetical protein
MDYDPTQGSGGLPIGRHPVVITRDEVTATKAGDGGMLVLTVEVIDGPQKGASGAYRLNLYSSSQVAAEIAHKQLSAICWALGVTQQITDTQVLHGQPFIIEVGPQKDNPQYTEVKKVFNMNGEEPGGNGNAGGGAAQPQQQQQQNNGGGGWGNNQQDQNQGGNNGGGWGNNGGGQQQQQQQSEPQNNNNGGGGWGQQQQQQEPQNNNNGGGNGGGWGQNQGGNSNGPAWGK